MQKDELARLVAYEYNEFVQAVGKLSEQQLHNAPAGKWTPAQLAAHLHLSIRPVTLAFALPAFLLRLFFGVTHRPVRTYEELVARYKQKLAGGGRAGRAFVPPLNVRLAGVLKHLHHQSHALATRVSRFSDAQLDELMLPHPLLGKLTLREMLYFTAYHAQHHRLQLP